MMCPSRRHLLTRCLAGLVCLLAVGLSGCFGAAANPYNKHYSSGDLNADPTLLNGTIVAASDLSGLRLQNITIKDATFLNTTASGAFLRNVVFDNCRFLNAKFSGAVLDNVTFKGGIITCELDPGNTDRRSEFVRSRFVNLLIDGTFLENAVFDGTDSTIIFRNVRQAVAVHPIVTGTNIRLTFEGCIFHHMTIAEVFGTSTLTAERCIFEYAYFGKSTFAQTTMRKNIIYGGPVYTVPVPSKRRR